MSNYQTELRKEWIAFWKIHREAFAKRLKLPPIPDKLFDLRCGAKTRAGTPCKQRTLFYNGRCKLHGGLSSGPKTAEGKTIAAANGRKKLALGNEPHVALRNADFPEPAPPKNITPLPVNMIFSQRKTSVSAVSCIGCRYMSAGYTCLIGKVFNLPAGEMRECKSFDALQI
jgi:hypothetical protein